VCYIQPWVVCTLNPQVPKMESSTDKWRTGVEIVQQPSSRAWLHTSFEELVATARRGSEAEEEALVTVFEEDLVPTDLVDGP
jgi:hypothetical protein